MFKVARRSWLSFRHRSDADQHRGHAFQKLRQGATPVECLHYAPSQPVSVVITGIDSPKILDQALEAVRTFRPMSEQEISALVSKTAKAAAHGEYELFKTSAHFDSTTNHPEWLGGETPRTEQLGKES